MQCFLATIIAVVILALSPVGDKQGTLKGHVDIGPLSPVQRVGQKKKVPKEVYKGLSLQLVKIGFKAPAQSAKIDESGNFNVNLDPSKYLVSVVSKTAKYMHLPSREVVISAGKTVKIDLIVDTGIR